MDPSMVGRYVAAIFYGIAQWFGEAIVGLFRY